MIWLILDDRNSPTIYKDSYTSYPVLEVVKPNDRPIFTIEDDFSDDDETILETRETNCSNYLSVSDQMIAQFFDRRDSDDEVFDLSLGLEDSSHERSMLRVTSKDPRLS